MRDLNIIICSPLRLRNIAVLDLSVIYGLDLTLPELVIFACGFDLALPELVILAYFTKEVSSL